MEKYSLYIETGNAAFEDMDKDAEISRILGVAAEHSASDVKVLQDINGNKVGKAVRGDLPNDLDANTFSLSFDMGNDAFVDDPAGEISRILSEAAKKVERGNLDFKIHDVNGNSIGSAEMTEGQSLEDSKDRSTVAEEAFEQYDFGSGVYVEDSDGWEHTSGENEMSRAVYVAVDDENDVGDDAPSIKLNFTAVFEPGSNKITEVYAIDEKGQIWENSLEKPLQLDKVNSFGGDVTDVVAIETSAPVNVAPVKQQSLQLDLLGGPIVASQGQFSGLILSVDGGFVTQRTGRNGATTVHDVSRLSATVKEGDVVDVKYRDGVGIVGGQEVGGKDVGR